MNMMQGFSAVQTQAADCCCKTNQNIKDTQYTIATTGANLQNQLNNCCCDVERQIERGFADTNYNLATQNCATLQAIDKVGDRVIDYLANKENQQLRDENFTYKLAASQQAQNNYLVQTLRPAPIPAYTVANPYCCNNNVYGYAGINGVFPYGTTIA